MKEVLNQPLLKGNGDQKLKEILEAAVPQIRWPGHFKLFDNEHCGYWFRCATLFKDPGTVSKFGSNIAQYFSSVGIEFGVVVGVGAVGSKLAFVTAGYASSHTRCIQSLGIDVVQEMAPGYPKKIVEFREEPFMEHSLKNRAVLVVDDVFSGDPFHQIVNFVSNRGGRVVGAAVIINPAAKVRLDGIPFYAISNQPCSYPASKCELCKSQMHFTDLRFKMPHENRKTEKDLFRLPREMVISP